MSKFAGFVVVMYIAGFFVAPMYSYTSEEKPHLIRQSTFADHVFWPVRAYTNWTMCGSISYCEKARCATLRGGCRGLGTIKSMPGGKRIIEKGHDPSLGQIGVVAVNPRSTDKYNPEAHRKFQELINKRKSVDSPRLAQHKKSGDEKTIFPWGQLTDPKSSKDTGVFGTVQPKKQLDLKAFRTNAYEAYQRALNEGKYTIILFDSEYCGFCKNMIKKLADPALAKYADRAIVSVTDGDQDKGARQLEEALGVVRYPTLIVLKTRRKPPLQVAGRIEGEVPVKEIDRIFEEAMKEPVGK